MEKLNVSINEHVHEEERLLLIMKSPQKMDIFHILHQDHEFEILSHSDE